MILNRFVIKSSNKPDKHNKLKNLNKYTFKSINICQEIFHFVSVLNFNGDQKSNAHT